MSWYALLFGLKGRLNRQGFWIGIAINFAFLFIVANFLRNPTAFEPIMLLPLGLSLYSVLAISAKRLHDRGRSGKNAFILFVPLVCYFMSQVATGTMAWLLGMLMPMLVGTLVLIEWGFFKSDEANLYGKEGLSLRFR